MEIFTIGFTKKNAEQFFGQLRQAGIRRLIDVRLNNTSTLAGFTRREDLPFFLRELCDIEYTHEPLLAPDDEILTAYRKGEMKWQEYEQRFLALMRARAVETRIARSLFGAKAVLLCSEPTATHCHRRLVAEYLRDHWRPVTIVHL